MKALHISQQPFRRYVGAHHVRSSFSTVQHCPSPSCACAATPQLDIDRDRELNGTMATYARHILVSTGKTDWNSRIEDDGAGTGWGELTRRLKSMLGRGGEFANPYNNVLVTTSSFDADLAPPSSTQPLTASAFMWPDLRRVKNIVVNDESIRNLIRRELLPVKAPPAQKVNSTAADKTDKVLNVDLLDQQRWQSPLVLICSHGGRDARCGTMGPLLQSEFKRLASESKVANSLPKILQSVSEHGTEEKFNIGLISHIGGHRFAGNVIVYFPSGYPADGRDLHPLEGKGIWYGRVEPKHVEGILERTLVRGEVIQELFRGGVNRDGGLLRL